MQLHYEEPLQALFQVQNMERLDFGTILKLRNLGIEDGSLVIVLRKYPFHGPVVIEFDNQRIGLRESVYQTIIGGLQNGKRCSAWKS